MTSSQQVLCANIITLHVNMENQPDSNYQTDFIKVSKIWLRDKINNIIGFSLFSVNSKQLVSTRVYKPLKKKVVD